MTSTLIVTIVIAIVGLHKCVCVVLLVNGIVEFELSDIVTTVKSSRKY